MGARGATRKRRRATGRRRLNLGKKRRPLSRNRELVCKQRRADVSPLPREIISHEAWCQIAGQHHYDIEDPPISRGLLGYIYTARCIRTGHVCAVKRTAHQSRAQNEVQILERIRSLDLDGSYALNEIYDVFGYNQGSVAIVMPWYAYSLEDHLDRLDQGLYGVAGGPCHRLDTRAIAKQCLEALAFLHANDIIHTNIQPETIMLKAEDVDCHGKLYRTDVVIVDFDLARAVSPAGRYEQRGTCSALNYQAPEMCTGQAWGPAVDLWSMGCVVAACHRGRPLIDAVPNYKKRREIYLKKLNALLTQPEPLQVGLDRSRRALLVAGRNNDLWLTELCSGLLRTKAEERLSAKDALSMNFFSEERIWEEIIWQPQDAPHTARWIRTDHRGELVDVEYIEEQIGVTPHIVYSEPTTVRFAKADSTDWGSLQIHGTVEDVLGQIHNYYQQHELEFGARWSLLSISDGELSFFERIDEDEIRDPQISTELD